MWLDHFLGGGSEGTAGPPGPAGSEWKPSGEFIATNGQTVYNLPSSPRGLDAIIGFINAAKIPQGGIVSVVGAAVTIDQDRVPLIEAGDIVEFAYQEA